MTKRKVGWSAADQQRLIDHVKAGGTPVRAAVLFKRSMINVQDRARKLGHPFPTINDRRRAMKQKIADADASAN